jgi:hypothetical protein
MTNTYDMLLNPPPSKPTKAEEKKADASLLANQQSSKAENQQTGKEANQQRGKPAKKKTSKPETSQASKPIKKFASYLAEDTFYELKAIAIQLRKKDYEVLQEAVEEYLKKKQGS